MSRAFPIYSRKTRGEANRSANGEDPVDGSVDQPIVNVEFILPEGEAVEQKDLDTLEHAAYGIQLAASIVDKPCNEMHTDAFVEAVQEVGNALGVKSTIIRGEELEKRGFGGIFGVGKAALHPPAMAVLSHTPAGATETIAWVGKGIVYDTGGLSIKV